MREYGFLSRVFLNFVDKNRKIDYIATALIAGWPILLAWYLGLHKSHELDGTIYIGYLDKNNFWPMVFLIPVSLWAVRWAFGRIAPITEPNLPAQPPGIIQLLHTKQAKDTVYHAMRSWMSSPKNMGSVLLVALAIQFIDMSELIGVYFIDQVARPGELDWSVMYKIGIVGKWTNFVFVVFAYIVQFMITVLGVYGVTFLLSHNLFFLSRIYQRSRTPAGEEDNYIAIDLNDVNKCFGFRAANDAFNTQVIALILGGAMVLVSRFPNSYTADGGVRLGDLLRWPMTIPETFFFPDIGQILLAIGWFAGLTIVSLPAIVKLLPRVPMGGKPPDLTITHYLREFLPDSQWPYGDKPKTREIEIIAAKFAVNAFWPTGNNRASQLFFFSSWIFLIILFPFQASDVSMLIIGFGMLGTVAYGIKTGLFVLLNSSLSYVDERLTQSRPDLLENAPEVQQKPRIQKKVFISYRRDDSAAYSRLLLQSLQEYMDESNIFMDIIKIHDGEDFVDAINDAVFNCDVLIAIIGKNWIDCRNQKGEQRIMQEDDFVRLEVAVALREKRLVIPVLVGGSTMPSVDELPEDIMALSRRQARELSDSRWEYDVSQLVKTLAEM